MIYTYMFIYIRKHIIKIWKKIKNYKLNLLNKRFLLDKLWNKQLKIYRSEINPSVSVCSQSQEHAA